MKNRKRVVLLVWVCLNAWCASAEQTVGDLLSRLDEAIAERPTYIQQKESELNHLKETLQYASSNEQKYEILGKLFTAYQSYNTDSSFYMAHAKYNLATRMNRAEFLADAQMNRAEVMGMTGMYKEALDLMNHIDYHQLPKSMHSYYYHVYRTVYGLLVDYAVTDDEKRAYSHLTDCYRDSLLITNDVGTLTHTLVKADQYNVRGDYDQSIETLSDYYAQSKHDEHILAMMSYTLSEAYRYKGNVEEEKRYLILSAIADMKSAVREYISLRKLAFILYQEGDVERAYQYLQQCMDDATACNARWRILEVQQMFPIINEAYHQTLLKQQRTTKVALVCISLLTLFLLLAIVYVYKQMKRVAAARREVMEANLRLKELNEELHCSNEKLKEANHSIAENSHLKEEYIGRYMDQCSIYLDKMDTYRRSLGRIAATGNVEELYKNIKSSKAMEGELKEFYGNFDNTFLQLFPTFVEEFNALLAEGEQIYPKGTERLTTELRIFALIRLGIADSVKISQFLRYSLTTIYNYRTKVRNKAVGDRDELEQMVMQIGKSRD